MTTIVLTTLGAFAIGRALARLAGRRTSPQRALAEIVVGIALLLMAGADLAGADPRLARALDVSSSVALAGAILLLIRADANASPRAESGPDRRESGPPR